MTTQAEPSLEQQLAERRAGMKAKAPTTVLEALHQDNAKMIVEGLYDRVPKEGGTVPDFTLPNVAGETVTLSELLKAGPVVLTFYRGGWCPYCNLQLRSYQAFLPRIKELGASLVAVSPQTPDNSLSTTEKLNLEFEVLSDVGGEVIRRYGLLFQVSEKVREFMENLGSDLVKFNGNDRWELPVPGTFVLDRQGVVRLAFVNPDYTYRLEPSRIIETLENLR